MARPDPRTFVAWILFLSLFMLAPTISEQYGSAAWRWIKLHYSGTAYAVDYASGSSTGGIAEAITACLSYADAHDTMGTVWVPEGLTTIDTTGMTSPALDLSVLTDSSGNRHAGCQLVGYGRGGVNQLLADPKAGSLILCKNTSAMTATDSRKACVGFSGTGQVIRDMYISTGSGTVDSQTTGIVCQTEASGGNVAGQRAVSMWSISNVGVVGKSDAGSGTTTQGTGLDMEFCLRGTVEESYFANWDNAIQYSLVDDGVGAYRTDTANNANNFIGNHVTLNDVGIHVVGSSSTGGGLACQDTNWIRNTVEGNEHGLYMDAYSTCHFFDSGNHWEQDKDTAVAPGVADVRILGTGVEFTSTGSYFDGDFSSAGQHIVRDAAQASTANWDSVYGAHFRNGETTYTNGAGISVNGKPATITTTGNTAAAPKMLGELHIADNATATADVTYSLPSAIPGMTGCFYDNGGGSGGVIVDANTGDEILLNGTSAGAGNPINSPGVAGAGANGDYICMTAIDATYWVTTDQSGVWVP